MNSQNHSTPNHRNKMKQLAHTVLALCSLCFLTSTHAGTEAGDDTARHYKSYPDKYNGKKIDVDCTAVHRINGGPSVEGVVFFVAHTIDRDNRGAGGSLVVAVPEDDAESFLRKYGNTIERNRGEAEKVDSKRLRGTFYQLDRGHVYLDESGEAHELILAKLDAAKGQIRAGDGIPTGGAGKLGKKKKKAF